VGPVDIGGPDSCVRLVPGGGPGRSNGSSPVEVLEVRMCSISLGMR